MCNVKQPLGRPIVFNKMFEAFRFRVPLTYTTLFRKGNILKYHFKFLLFLKCSNTKHGNNDNLSI